MNSLCLLQQVTRHLAFGRGQYPMELFTRAPGDLQCSSLGQFSETAANSWAAQPTQPLGKPSLDGWTYVPEAPRGP